MSTGRSTFFTVPYKPKISSKCSLLTFLESWLMLSFVGGGDLERFSFLSAERDPRLLADDDEEDERDLLRDLRFSSFFSSSLQ